MVLTFSTKFPASHPRKTEPTFFVEKIMASLADCIDGWEMYNDFVLYDWHEYYNAIPKHHTIRAGNRWKVGDFFSPRIWSGKPYASKQIEFAPPIQVKKTWPFEVDENGVASLDGTYLFGEEDENTLAKNDGLSWQDFHDWLLMPCYKKGKPFKGQVICWNSEIHY
jgi:hypothetical protein